MLQRICAHHARKQRGNGTVTRSVLFIRPRQILCWDASHTHGNRSGCRQTLVSGGEQTQAQKQCSRKTVRRRPSQGLQQSRQRIGLFPAASWRSLVSLYLVCVVSVRVVTDCRQSKKLERPVQDLDVALAVVVRITVNVEGRLALDRLDSKLLDPPRLDALLVFFQKDALQPQ